MKNAAAKARRLAHVQRQIKDRALRELREIGSRLIDLECARADLIALLNRADAPDGMMLESVVRRLRRLSWQANELEKEKQGREQRLRQQSLRVARAENHGEAVGRQQRIETEKAELMDLMDALAGRKDASFR